MCQHPVNMRKGIDSLFSLIHAEQERKAAERNAFQHPGGHPLQDGPT
jgi:hypothetical protein